MQAYHLRVAFNLRALEGGGLVMHMGRHPPQAPPLSYGSGPASFSAVLKVINAMTNDKSLCCDCYNSIQFNEFEISEIESIVILVTQWG